MLHHGLDKVAKTIGQLTVLLLALILVGLPVMALGLLWELRLLPA